MQNVIQPVERPERAQSATSSLIPTEYVRSCKPSHLRIQIQVALRLHIFRWRRTRNIWASAFRSFREDIRLRYTKAGVLGDIGPALLVDANGNLRENIEILPRILYTEKWHLAFCSADEVDLEIFQMGFDAAE
jgi:hypothetical protein